MNTARLKDDLKQGPTAPGHVPKEAIEASKELKKGIKSVPPPPKPDKFSDEKVSDALPDEVVEEGVVDRTVESG